MCAIVDNNVRDRFFRQPVDDDLQPLWKWIDDGKGVLVVGGHLLTELSGSRNAADAIQTWERAGRAVIVDKVRVDDETQRLRADGSCVSDDEHVIALARLSGARRLCSDDRLLHQDFRNPALINNPRGRVYQYRSQAANLLNHEGSCPLDAPRAERRRGGRRR